MNGTGPSVSRRGLLKGGLLALPALAGSRMLSALVSSPDDAVAAAAALPFFGGELMPAFREGHFVVQLVAPPGTSLAAMMRTGEKISAELLAIPGIRTASEQIGRAEAGEVIM